MATAETLDSEHDPHRWLEDVTGADALRWVSERNAESVRDLTRAPLFASLRDEIREVLDADTRIPYVIRRGGHLYNFWQDAEHPRGVWRRTTLADYRADEPAWEVVLDLDSLADEEGENWVWGGATVLEPEYRRCLVSLSRGGADATVVREFDAVTKSFVPDGFELPEAKSTVEWVDADTVYVATDFGPGSMTESGYPRIVKRWRRGAPLDDAILVFEARPADLEVAAWHDPTTGRDFVSRAVDFYRSELYLAAGDELVRIDTPDDAITSAHRDWLLVEPRSPWTVGRTTYPAGSLLATPFDGYLAGQRDLTVLFEPDDHSALASYRWTRDHLIVTSLDDVRSRVEVLSPQADGWRRERLTAVPDHCSIEVRATDPHHSNEYWLVVEGFRRPATLQRGVTGEATRETLKAAPSFFDASGLTVEQAFATSADGTAVPYFVVRPDELGDGPHPTLLSGYGGFEIARLPRYDGTIGRAWLAGGGVYVVANIRGGGEYGPRWHQAALKENRPLAYADFAAVAKDLVARGITTPARLAIRGGSNGGLLMGNMLIRYPELFGAVVAQVPLLDMRRYHRLLAGASWMAEYGDPDDPDEWAFIRGFSPYHNLTTGQAYPPTLITTSTRDDRVHPGHARKMAAAMRALGYDVAYYENIEGGHGGAANNEQTAFMEALIFSFLWQRLGG